MIDVLILITVIVISLILLGISFYILVVYVHPDDKGWGTALYCKILVILSMAVCWTQALMLPLDVSNAQLPAQSQINMGIFWPIIYFVTLGMVAILLPYAIFFYETDPNKTYLRRFFTAFLYLLATLTVVCIALFVSWHFLKYVDLPIYYIGSAASDITQSANTATANISTTTNGSDITYTTQCSFVIYVMAIMSFAGWILLILFGGVGLYALPIDLINEYRRRPRPRKSNLMKATRQALIRAIEQLSATSEQLKEECHNLQNNDQDKLLTKITKRNAYNTKFNEFKCRFTLIAEEFQIFQLQLHYLDSSPIKSLMTLTSGIVFLITSLLWTYQIVIGYLPSTKYGQPLLPSLNNLFYLIQQSSVAFFATIFYGYMILYLVWCVIKGNLKFGLRVPCLFRLHPMKPNDTWMNSFLVNMIMILLASCAVTQFSTGCFSYYAADAEIFQIYGTQVNYMRFYRWCYDKKIMPSIFLGWAILVLIYMLIKCNRPPEYIKQIQAIRSMKGPVRYQGVKQSWRERQSQKQEEQSVSED